LSADDPRLVVRDCVAAVRPFDAREAADQADILAWIASGAPLFRTRRYPANPRRHLVVYAALVDDAARMIMLVDHRKGQLWLLPGGHVDDGEDPRRSVERETLEELGISPAFHEKFGGQPCFASIAQTRGVDSHTDVSLWFVLKGDAGAEVYPDLSEFSEVRWFGLDDPAMDWSASCFDPHMGRFMGKLASLLETGTLG
jgi:8-oxo-dGTP pyrophosphatase MutT (NUDIX family)